MFPEFCTYMASVNDWGSPMPADDRNLIPPLTPEEIERRKALPEAAQRALDVFGDASLRLRQLADYLLNRDY